MDGKVVRYEGAIIFEDQDGQHRAHRLRANPAATSGTQQHEIGQRGAATHDNRLRLTPAGGGWLSHKEIVDDTELFNALVPLQVVLSVLLHVLRNRLAG